MPLNVETLIPAGSTNIFGEQPSEELLTALGTRLPFLPVCTYKDLKDTILYSHNPVLYEEENLSLHPEMGDAYAWRRLPRFIDRFKEVRMKMLSTYPNQLVLSLDVGSSIPIYSEMMRAHWLRKCGDHAQQAFDYAAANLGDRTKTTNVTLEQHSRKSAPFKKAFISCLQTALYCIPYDRSGDEPAIRDYLEECLHFFLANSKRFIDRSDRKNHLRLEEVYELFGIDFDPQLIKRVPLERAWRIDSPLGPTQDTTCLEEVTGTKYSEPLTPSSEARSRELAGGISRAKKDRDHVLESKLRKELTKIINSRVVSSVTQDEATLFLSYMVSSAVDFVLKSGYAPPVRFVSLDQRDPAELAQEVESSLDAETKLSGFCRRTVDRLKHGDPDHIHDSISRIGHHILSQSVSSITSIESYPFYAEQPESIRHIEQRAERIARDMMELCATLKKQGEYMTFPWGTSAFSNAEDGRSAKLAREKLPSEILKKIAQANLEGELLISVEVYSPQQVQRWMSQGEFDSLLNLSPAIRTDSDELVEVLRIRGAKKAPPSGKLLGARQLRSEP